MLPEKAFWSARSPSTMRCATASATTPFSISPRKKATALALHHGVEGFCVGKAALLRPCARADGIPARIGSPTQEPSHHPALRERMGTAFFTRIHRSAAGRKMVNATPPSSRLCRGFRVKAWIRRPADRSSSFRRKTPPHGIPPTAASSDLPVSGNHAGLPEATRAYAGGGATKARRRPAELL